MDIINFATAGFAAVAASWQSRDGAVLENEIMEIARGGNMRVIGPNCLGVMVRSRLGTAEIKSF